MNKKITDKKWLMYVLVAICALFWGFSFLGTTVALRSLQPVQLLSMRWTISAVIFLLLALIGILKVKFTKQNVWKIFAVGLLQPSIYSIFETNGINLTTTSESSIFIATIPIMVLILGRLFFKKRYTARVVNAIIIAFTGVAICVVFSPTFSIGGKGIGYLILIGAVIVGALYCYASGFVSKEFGTMEITFAISITGAIFFNIISFIKGYGLSGYKICMEDYKLFFAVAFLGVCCSCICYIIFNFVLGVLPAAIAANLISNSTTAIGVISGVVFAGDAFGWYVVVGLILTISGIVLASLPNGELHKKPKL